MYKFIAQFVGIAKTVYANNIGQAFQEADVFAAKHGLEKHSITDCEIFVQNPPYFGIYS